MNTTATETVSITDMPGTRADAQVTVAQITRGILMSCGARDIVSDNENGTVWFRVGPNGKKVRKVIVKLMPNDTYAVEYGWFTMDHRRDDFGIWHTVEQEFDVYAEALAATVRRLGDRERY